MNEFEVDAELLITLVEERPVLWDKTLEIYKDKNLTKDAWRSICIYFKDDFDTLSDAERNNFGKHIIKKWTNIRDQWIKWCRREKDMKDSGIRASKLRKYIFNDQMQFMKKWQNETTSREDGHVQQSGEQTSNLEKDVISAQSSKRAATTERGRISSCLREKRKSDEFESRIIQALERTPQTEDRHLMFFKGVLPSIQKFDEEQTLDFQMGVLQLIRDIQQRAVLQRF